MKSKISPTKRGRIVGWLRETLVPTATANAERIFILQGGANVGDMVTTRKLNLKEQVIVISITIILIAILTLAFIFLINEEQQANMKYIAIGASILIAIVGFAFSIFFKRKELIPAPIPVVQVAVAREINQNVNTSSIKPQTQPKHYSAHNGTVALSISTVALSEAYLTVESGGRQERITLTDSSVVIGRGQTYGTYIITDSAISGSHCRIEKVNDCYLLTDLSSTNGTKLNGTKLVQQKQYPLNQGDLIRTGRTEFKFDIGK